MSNLINVDLSCQSDICKSFVLKFVVDHIAEIIVFMCIPMFAQTIVERARDFHSNESKGIWCVSKETILVL